MQEEPQYNEITIATHLEAVEGVLDILLALGAKGVVEERDAEQVRITAYLFKEDNLDEQVRAVKARLDALARVGLQIAPATLGIRTVGTEAWIEAWKNHFKVAHIAPGLVIAPSWENYLPQPGEAVVILDPGAAFGTGGHPTTRLCLRGIAQYFRTEDRVADVGCGSGILAIAAALLGAKEVLATDSDHSVLGIASHNAEHNSIADRIRIIEADLLPIEERPFDLIVCNILATEVVRLAAQLDMLLSPGGRFIGSGFTTDMIPMVEDALARAGLQIVTTLIEENWAACVGIKSNSEPT